MSNPGNERERQGGPWRRYRWVVGVLSGGFLFGLSIGAGVAHLRRNLADAGDESQGTVPTVGSPRGVRQQPRAATRKGLVLQPPVVSGAEVARDPVATEKAGRCTEPLPSVVVVPRRTWEPLTRVARVVPVMQDGKPQGFMVLAAPGAEAGGSAPFPGADPLAPLGLCSGDIIRAVAGIPLDSPDQALGAYAKVKDARTVEVQIGRRGREATVQYVFAEATAPAVSL